MAKVYPCPACGEDNSYPPGEPNKPWPCANCEIWYSENDAAAATAAAANPGRGKLWLLLGIVVLFLAAGGIAAVYFTDKWKKDAETAKKNAENRALAEQWREQEREGRAQVKEAKAKLKELDDARDKKLAADLAALTEREKTPPATAEAQAQFARDYYEVFMKMKPADQAVPGRRVLHWYRAAYPELTELGRDPADERMAEAARAVNNDDAKTKQFGVYAGTWRVGVRGPKNARAAYEFTITADGKAAITAATDDRAGRTGVLSRPLGHSSDADLTWDGGALPLRLSPARGGLALYEYVKADNRSSSRGVGTAVLVRPGGKSPSLDDLVFMPSAGGAGKQDEWWADFPGSATGGSSRQKTGKVTGRTSLTTDSGAVYAVQYDGSDDAPPEDDMFAAAEKAIPKAAKDKTPLTFGTRPAVDYTLDVSTTNGPAVIRTRLVAVNGRLYRLSVTWPAGKPERPAWVTRFLDSFRVAMSDAEFKPKP